MKRNVFIDAFKASLPILLGYGTMGFAAGIAFASSCGLDCAALWSGGIAAFSLSGTLQFVIGKWIGQGLGLCEVAFLTFLISFRYALYGFSLIGRWRGVGFFRKCFLISGLADENYALEASRQYPSRADFIRFCTYLTALDISYWTAGTTLGALVGSLYPVPASGMNFIMAALFISIFTDQVKGLAAELRKNARSKREARDA